jgi:hypothetical protein
VTTVNAFIDEGLVTGDDLDAYLRGLDWVVVSRTEGQFGQWASPDRTTDVLIPLNTQWSDYRDRVAAAVQQIAAATQLPVERVLREVAMTRADVVLLRAAIDTPADGSITLVDGLSLLRGGYDAVEAAALAEVDRRAYYTGVRPQRVTTYMNQVRLGQTEVGSFVVPIISRVSPPTPPPGELPSVQEGIEPFERRVTRRLVVGVKAAVDAAGAAEASGDFSSFTAAVGDGVSANLCDALGDLDPQGRTSSVTFRVRWSRVLADNPPPAVVTVPTSLRATFKEAAQRLRPQERDRIVTVVGPVEHLDRVGDERDGTIGVRATLDGVTRKVFIDLPEEWYLQAVTAHGLGKPILCRGLLVVRGPRRSLANVTDFSVPDELPGLSE